MVERLTPHGAPSEPERIDAGLAPTPAVTPQPLEASAPEARAKQRERDRLEPGGRPSRSALSRKLEAFDDAQKVQNSEDAERLFIGRHRRAPVVGETDAVATLAAQRAAAKRLGRRVAPKAGSAHLGFGRRPTASGVLMPHLGQLVKGTSRTAMLGRRQSTRHRPHGLPNEGSIIST